MQSYKGTPSDQGLLVNHRMKGLGNEMEGNSAILLPVGQGGDNGIDNRWIRLKLDEGLFQFNEIRVPSGGRVLPIA